MKSSASFVISMGIVHHSFKTRRKKKVRGSNICKNKISEFVAKFEKDSLMVYFHSTSTILRNLWCVDSGASRHSDINPIVAL